MRRLHFVELEDLPWVPTSIRDGGTDILDLLFAAIGFYRPMVARLQAFIAATGERELVDLCSGGGGGALAMWSLLDEEAKRGLRLTLTDRFPSAAAIARVQALADPRVHYHSEPVDALAATGALPGIRTMFSALHHFRPEAVQRLIQAAIDDRAPIALFDVAASPALRRVPLALAPIVGLVNAAFLLPLPLLLTPFVRPFRWSRLAWTYLLPAIPILFGWDGTVSAMRAYTPEELLALARALPGADGYTWEAARAGLGCCLLGAPNSPHSPA